MYICMNICMNELMKRQYFYFCLLLKKLFFRYFMIFDRNKASGKEVSFIMRKSSR